MNEQEHSKHRVYMTNEWKKKVLKLRYWDNREEALEYAALVEMAKYRCDLDTCRCLMKTFVTEQDCGVQESVNGVLSTARPEDRQRALLEELPRLVVDTPEWAESLIEIELRHNLDSFRETAQSITPEERAALRQILNQASFRAQFSDLGLAFDQ